MSQQNASDWASRLVQFQRILRERKRRELDPTLVVLEQAVRSRTGVADQPVMQARLIEIQRFRTLIDAVANRVLDLRELDADGLRCLLGADTHP